MVDEVSDMLSARAPDPRVAALTAALDAITAACTEACDDRRRTYPTYGLVSAALIAAIAEEAKR